MEGTGKYGEKKREQSSMSVPNNRPFSSVMPPLASKHPLPLPSSPSPSRLYLKSHSLTINDNSSVAFDHKPDLPHKSNDVLKAAFHEDDDSKPIIDQQQQQSQQPPQDLRKLNRLVSNRLSAQRCKMRKHQHVASLERQSRIFENQIAFLQPQIQAYSNENKLLLLEKRVLTEKLATLEKEKIVKQAEIQLHQAEVKMLRERQKQQKQELENQAMMAYHNWNNTFLNDQFVPEPMVYPNYTIQGGGLENTEGTSSGILEVNDEQINEMNFNMNDDTMNELDAIVNPWIMETNKDSNTVSGHGDN